MGSGEAPISWHVEHHEVVNSTQELAHAWLDLVEAGDRVGVFVAEHQREGAGRMGRRWVDEAGNGLLMSIGIPGTLLSQELLLEGIGPRVAQAVARAVARASSCAVAWRAPNDLYVGERKLGGVLIDARTVGAVVERLVLGIGINVSGLEFEVDGRLATSLEAVGASGVDRGVLRSTVSLAAVRAIHAPNG